MIAHQASCVAIAGRGLMIEGPPGSGKSSLALALIDRGAVLVGDDAVLIELSGAKLIAHPHPNTRGLIEVRNLGLLNFPAAKTAEIALVLRLDPTAQRFIEDAEWTEIAGVSLPLIRLIPHDPIQHLKAEMALKRYGG